MQACINGYVEGGYKKRTALLIQFSAVHWSKRYGNGRWLLQELEACPDSGVHSASPQEETVSPSISFTHHRFRYLYCLEYKASSSI